LNKEKRSLKEMIFGAPKIQDQATALKILSGYSPFFSPYRGNSYQSDVVRSAVDAIARNGAKLMAKHIVKNDAGITEINKNIAYMLQTQPNPLMNAFAFFYKLITTLQLENNAFVYPQKDTVTGRIVAFWPIQPTVMELKESKGEIIASFYFGSGDSATVFYDELIHLRKFYYKNDIYGEDNQALIPTLELIDTTNKGIINAIKSSAFLRGIIKFTGLSIGDDQKKIRDNFVKDYFGVDNNGGIAALDNKAEFTELKNSPTITDADQMAYIKTTVYNYFGINEKIISSSYTEADWVAFYESVLEPIAVQMSLEFTSKIFTAREQGVGNQIVFESNRLQYADSKTKSMLIKNLLQLGVLTINEARDILNMAPVEGGEKRIITLNVADANKIDQYQGVDDTPVNPNSDTGGTKDDTNQ
jgi:HK97 family phage portal protein